jgi:hypothetical protein
VELVFETLAKSIISNGKAIVKPSRSLQSMPESFDSPMALLDYLTIRFCEEMDDQDIAMHMVRKQVKDEGIDFQKFDGNSAKRLIKRLITMHQEFKDENSSRLFKMDLMKAYWRFNGKPDI